MKKVSIVLPPYMEEQDLKTREKILRGAEELFMKYGVRSVSMDDIARHLSVSKKTIYQYFADKDEVVTQVAMRHLAQHDAEIQAITAGSKNALEELMRISVSMKRHLQAINPVVLFDIKKYHGKAWEVWTEHKNKKIRDSVIGNIRQGIEEGLFRNNLNPEIVAAMRIEMIQFVFDPSIFPAERFSMVDVHLQVLDHFMYGLLTDKGRKLYEKYKQEPINLELIPHNV